MSRFRLKVIEWITVAVVIAILIAILSPRCSRSTPEPITEVPLTR